ncbi:hypothetical protein J6590_053449 [Homalodisca vitripennis]|nr:hypothetical protein J6590_053449 [Homalodisca vitripennis]
MFPVRLPGALPPQVQAHQRQLAAQRQAAAAAAAGAAAGSGAAVAGPSGGPAGSKPQVKVQVRPFTRESLDKHESKTVQLVRDYGFQPRRKLSVEDGSVLPCKFEPFPARLYGRPLEEIDNFIYDERCGSTTNRGDCNPSETESSSELKQRSRVVP